MVWYAHRDITILKITGQDATMIHMDIESKAEMMFGK